MILTDYLNEMEYAVGRRPDIWNGQPNRRLRPTNGRFAHWPESLREMVKNGDRVTKVHDLPDDMTALKKIRSAHHPDRNPDAGEEAGQDAHGDPVNPTEA